MIELKGVEEETEKKKAESVEIEELISTIEIKDHKSLEDAVGWVAQIKRQHNEIETQRKEVAGPLTEATKKLNAFFKGPTTPLLRAETALKSKIADYTGNCYSERGRLLSEVINMEKTADKQKVIAEAEAFIPPRIAGMSVSEFWAGDVTDPEAVKRWAIQNNRTELLLINGKVLDALTKAAGKDPEIPGWDAAQKIRIAITESKVK